MTKQLRRSRARRWMWAGLIVVAVAAVVATVLVLPGSDEPVAAPEPALISPDPAVVPLGDGAPAPTEQGLAAALASALGNPGLGQFSAVVGDGTEGRVLWSVGADQPMIPASTAKLLTASAALLALPHDQRVTTRAVAGADGDVVLVGGGDPTLSVGNDAASWFSDGARISDLADQIRAAGVPMSRVVVDISLYEGPDWAPGWFPEDVGDGYIAPIEPVMLDAARLDPTKDESPRSSTPALDAGRALAGALGLDPAQVVVGAAPADAQQIGAVESAPLVTRLRQMLSGSDNVLAEAVGREVALATGRPASFAGATDAVLSELRSAGFAVDNVVLADTSGLSEDDRVSATQLGSLIAAAAGPESAASTSDLRPLLDMLPVAGGTGTLADRYIGADRTGAGWVRAKTGTLTVAGALAGIVTDVDGRVLTFALMSNGSPPDASRPALDGVARALRQCGCA